MFVKKTDPLQESSTLHLMSFILGDWNEIGVGSSINLTADESIQVPELEIAITP